MVTFKLFQNYFLSTSTAFGAARCRKLLYQILIELSRQTRKQRTQTVVKLSNLRLRFDLNHCCFLKP